jgi:predicted nucleic acid-binding Zn ribbon protein
MSKHNQHTIKDAIEQLLKVYRLDDKLAESRLVAAWEDVMGKMIAKHTKEIVIRQQQLIVTLDSSALRNELALAKTKIVKMMNDTVGRTIITEIILK